MKIEMHFDSEVKMVFSPPTLEEYTKEEFEEILDASACGSNGGTFACPCYMGTLVNQYYSTACTPA